MKKSILIQRKMILALKMDSWLLEVKRQTKKKDAQITITIPDELAQQLIADSFRGVSEPFDVTSLRLVWDEREV